MNLHAYRKTYIYFIIVLDEYKPIIWIKKSANFIEIWDINEPTKGGAHAKHAVSPGISNCIWPDTASSDTPAQK